MDRLRFCENGTLGFTIQIPRLPSGGADALALARGRDCTALFESYHPFSDKPRQLLPKFLVPSACVSGAFAASGSGDTFYVQLGPDDQATRVRDPFWVGCFACGIEPRSSSPSPDTSTHSF